MRARAIRQDDEWRLMKLGLGEKSAEGRLCVQFISRAADIQHSPSCLVSPPLSVESGPQLSMNFPHGAKTHKPNLPHSGAHHFSFLSEYKLPISRFLFACAILAHSRVCMFISGLGDIMLLYFRVSLFATHAASRTPRVNRDLTAQHFPSKLMATFSVRGRRKLRYDFVAKKLYFVDDTAARLIFN